METEPEDTIVTHRTVVACDGGGGPLGHPRVFLHMDDDGEVVCPYCSRRFVLSETAPAPAHG